MKMMCNRAKTTAIIITLFVIWAWKLQGRLIVNYHSSSEERYSFVTESPRVLFYFFPQWHPVPENNRIHGWDFTDWKLIMDVLEVAANRYLIQQPTELGWYNLLSHDVRLRQSQLLTQYGGYGFIYHIYWFTDHPVMDEVFRQMLVDTDINVPYFFSWANEDWFNRWYGGDARTVFHVNISSQSSRRKFFSFLLPFFRDPRYIKVNGKPVFQVYLANDDMELVFKDFKNWAVEAGLPGLHCHQTLGHFHKRVFNSSHPSEYKVYVSPAADGVSEFQPNFIQQWTQEYVTATAQIPRHHPNYHWRGLYVDWDDGPRRRRFASKRSHPFLFERYLRLVMDAMRHDILSSSLSSNDQYITVNAWNEWSEGNTVEPSHIYGRAYLEAVETALLKHAKHTRVCILVESFTMQPPFYATSKTLNSLEAFLTDMQWEALVYLAYPAVKVPVEFMNFIRHRNARRIRFVDVPISLQQTNTSASELLQYMIHNCHAVRYAHYIIQLRESEILRGVPKAPLNLDEPWVFSLKTCRLNSLQRMAQRIGYLQVNQDAFDAFALNLKDGQRCN